MLQVKSLYAHLRIAGIKSPIYVTGLPYGKEEVRGRIDSNIPLKERTKSSWLCGSLGR